MKTIGPLLSGIAAHAGHAGISLACPYDRIRLRRGNGTEKEISLRWRRPSQWTSGTDRTGMGFYAMAYGKNARWLDALDVTS